MSIPVPQSRIKKREFSFITIANEERRRGREVRPVHLLFECATGYALFLANGIAEVDLLMFKKVEEYINRSPQPLELKAYLPFSSLDDALVEMKAVSTSNVTEKLKQFLLDHAPKPTNLLHIGTSDPFMGHQIVLGTGMGARHSVLIRNVMRALRDKTDQFLCLQPGQLERAQMDLARLYINQRHTGMYADSPLVISSSPSSIQEQVGVVPHRFEGLFSVKGEEGILCTKNLVPGEALFGERLIRVQNEDRTEEYRVWDSHRSKLGAAIHHGVTNIWIKPGSRVLYLGNVCGLTVSDLSDLVGSEGLVYVVGFSENVVEMAGKRPNVLTINAKWCFSHHQYRMLVGMVDVLFAEIDYHRVQPELYCEEARLAVLNARAYLRTAGHYMISIQTTDMNSTDRFVFASRDEMEFNPVETVKLDMMDGAYVLDVVGFLTPEE